MGRAVVMSKEAMTSRHQIGSGSPDAIGLSYKFQRLREKLRQAIASGEISGKLPGERALSQKFGVNAKTLSKALTDLAAEGLLDRRIGRGTYVKGHQPARTDRRWLLLCDPEQANWETVELLRGIRPDLKILTDAGGLRPSLLGGFAAVIDLSPRTPAEFLRELVVRNFPVVSVGKLPQTFSTHAVLFDGAMATSQAGRDLLLQGHEKLAAIEPSNCTVVASTLMAVKGRYAPDAVVKVGTPADVPALLEHGVTAFVCHCCDLAEQVADQLNKLGVSAPQHVSLMAIGCSSDHQPCSGYYVHRREKVDSIVRLLADTQSHRPTTLWLAGRYVDHGTTGHAPMAAIHPMHAPMIVASKTS